MQKPTSFNVNALLLSLLAVAVVSGGLRFWLTGSLASGHKVQLTFWNGFTGPDGIVMLHIIDQFNTANPGVEVRMQRIPWATYYNKLTVEGADGRAPAIFVSHADALSRVRRAGFMDTVDDAFGPGKIDPADFDRLAIQNTIFQGRHFGVPLDIHPFGLYVDTDMLKSAGVVDKNGNASVPTTRAEFEDALIKMNAESGPDQLDRHWGYALTDWSANARVLVAQFDGHYLDEKGNADLACPPNVRALTYLYDLAKKKRVPPPSTGLGWIGFRQKKVGMVWDGVYMLGDLMRVNSFHYLGGMVPTIGNHPGTTANSHVLCIRKGLSPAERQAALRFIRFLSDHDLDWAAAGQVPARVSLRKTRRFAAMQVQSQFARQIPWMQYPPKTPVIFDVMNYFGLAAEHVVRLDETPEAALKEANKSVQQSIDRDRIEHPEAQ